mmetsp:Transcript_10198/g.27734  ORF Transcript_10198/g.27734 Transcript_10198/m.27734 type:complete len:310 (-) Transcript_10198:67-996(-)
MASGAVWYCAGGGEKGRRAPRAPAGAAEGGSVRLRSSRRVLAMLATTSSRDRTSRASRTCAWCSTPPWASRWSMVESATAATLSMSGTSGSGSSSRKEDEAWMLQGAPSPHAASTAASSASSCTSSATWPRLSSSQLWNSHRSASRSSTCASRMRTSGGCTDTMVMPKWRRDFHLSRRFINWVNMLRSATACQKRWSRVRRAYTAAKRSAASAVCVTSSSAVRCAWPPASCASGSCVASQRSSSDSSAALRLDVLTALRRSAAARHACAVDFTTTVMSTASIASLGSRAQGGYLLIHWGGREEDASSPT